MTHTPHFGPVNLCRFGGALAVIAVLVGASVSIAYAEDGHTATGRPCWATSGTIGGVFHAGSLDCIPNSSAQQTAPQPDGHNPQGQPCWTHSVDIGGIHYSRSLDCVANAAPPVVDPGSTSNSDQSQSLSGATLSVSVNVSLYTGWAEYNASGTGLPGGQEVDLALFDADGNLVMSRHAGVSMNGSLEAPVGVRLPPGDYGLVALRAGSDVILATAAFSAPDDASAQLLPDGGAPASDASSNYIPPWQTCTGLGAACPGLNPFGPFTS
jgi:hypothetical protein